jgi:molecular chaperone GrpE
MITEKPAEKEAIQKLKEELEEKSKLSEDRLNQLKYLQADFDNYRKNFEKEKKDIIKLANENLIKEFLIILDDLERAQKENENNKGLSLLYKNFLKILEKNGLKQIESLGKKFNPNLHEVLMKEESEEDEGIILEEFQKGFMLKDKVIRPSKVKISGEK